MTIDCGGEASNLTTPGYPNPRLQYGIDTPEIIYEVAKLIPAISILFPAAGQNVTTPHRLTTTAAQLSEANPKYGRFGVQVIPITGKSNPPSPLTPTTVRPSLQSTTKCCVGPEMQEMPEILKNATPPTIPVTSCTPHAARRSRPSSGCVGNEVGSVPDPPSHHPGPQPRGENPGYEIRLFFDKAKGVRISSQGSGGVRGISLGLRDFTRDEGLGKVLLFGKEDLELLHVYTGSLR